MKKRTKKVKVWGKIKLYEASAVGIASYPDAHLSTECSLLKALSESGDELNKEKEIIMPEEKKAEESQEPKEPESSEKPEEEKSEEKSEEESSEEKPEESEKESKPVTLKDIQEVFAKSLKDALKGSETQRGLVMTEKEVREKLSEKSVGELAMMQGLFVPK